MSSSDGRKYWFPAKRFGWGWGPPSTWQGWIVLLVYVVLLVSGALFFALRGSELLVVPFAIVLSLVLIAICSAKGEPQR
ncbi:MAG: hypothetical protein ACREOU_09440 [Candidatus Eiseniibacteriota bacterium]